MASRTAAEMGEERASEIRKMILEEMDTAVASYRQVKVSPEAQGEKALSVTLNGVNRKEINRFLEEVEENKGRTNFKYNQVPIIPVSAEYAENVKKATGGRTNISGKILALEGGKLYHEIHKHSDPSSNLLAGQVIYDVDRMDDILDTMINPDYLEDLAQVFTGDQRDSFACIKEKEDVFIVVLAVGGKRNPNITAEEILCFSKKGFHDNFDGRTIAEVIYSRQWRQLKEKNAEAIKKNRVTVAHDESKDSSAPNVRNVPRSPLSNSNLAQNKDNNNTEQKFSLNMAENVKKSDYSYDTLIKKSDIPVYAAEDFSLGLFAMSKDLQRRDVIKKLKENIFSYNKQKGNNLGDGALFNNDIGAPISINNESIKHGLIRMKEESVNGMLHLPLYLENAIVINEANGLRQGADKSYVLAGVYEDEGIHVARMVVNRFGGNLKVDKIEEALYSAQTKKGSGPLYGARARSSAPFLLTSNFTIQQLLYAVKECYPNELSADVAAHLDYNRQPSDIQGLRYSLSGIDGDLFSLYDNDFFSSGLFAADAAVSAPLQAKKVNYAATITASALNVRTGPGTGWEIAKVGGHSFVLPHGCRD